MAPLHALCCATAALVLAACDREPPKPKVGTGGAVAARVNGNAVAPHASQYALERAIDQEVIVQRAVADGLDREPHVASRLEAARRQVLTQAWFDRFTEAAGEPSAEDVTAFRASHPQVLPNMPAEQAEPLIRKHLARQRGLEAARAEVERLRREARIEYANPAIAGVF
jgi:hypothetical protein